MLQSNIDEQGPAHSFVPELCKKLTIAKIPIPPLHRTGLSSCRNPPPGTPPFNEPTNRAIVSSVQRGPACNTSRLRSPATSRQKSSCSTAQLNQKRAASHRNISAFDISMHHSSPTSLILGALPAHSPANERFCETLVYAVQTIVPCGANARPNSSQARPRR